MYNIYLSYRLLTFLWNKFGAPAVGPGMYNGYITYPKAIEFLRNGASRTFDSMSLVPYATQDRNWVSYEDRESIYQKVNNFNVIILPILMCFLIRDYLYQL